VKECKCYATTDEQPNLSLPELLNATYGRL